MVSGHLQVQWIARVDGLLVASGVDAKEVLAEAEKVAPRSRIVLECVLPGSFASGFQYFVAAAAGSRPGVKPLTRKARDDLAEKLYGSS